MAQKSRIHQHLVKPLIWREAPEGLYPFPLFWMEGKKDMEGFLAALLVHVCQGADPIHAG